MRQLISFFIVGVVQFGIDSSIYTLLNYMGAQIIFANLISRAVAACAGYCINGAITFKKPLNGKNLIKFIAYWGAMTALSTVLLYMCSHFVFKSHEVEQIAISKIIVEIFLFFVSFAIAKKWVYSK
jgi:putative flippase GtrA